MKGPVRNPSTYQFNAAGKTLTFLAPIPTFQGQILGAFNLTRQAWIYLPQKVGANGISYAGTWSSPTLTLAFDTTAHSNTDSLQVFYDDGLTTQAVAPDVEVGGGAITAKTQRFTLATDDSIVTALGSDGTSPPTLPGSSTGIRGWLRYLASLLPQDAATANNQQAANELLTESNSYLPFVVDYTGSTQTRLGTTGTGAPTLPSGASGLAGLVQVFYQALLDRLPATLSGGRLQVAPSLAADAATAANQATANTLLAAIDADLGSDGPAVTALASLDSKSPPLIDNRTPVIWVPGTPLDASYSFTGAIALNTVLLSINCSNCSALSIETSSIGTGGAIAVEWSNTGTFYGPPVLLHQNISSTNSAAIAAAGFVTVPRMGKFARLRQSTAATGGTTSVAVAQLIDSPAVTTTTQLSSGIALIGGVCTGYSSNLNITSASFVSIVATAGVNAALIKGTAGKPLRFDFYNGTGSLAVFKLHNTSLVPTVGTTPAGFRVAVPAGGSRDGGLEGGWAHTTGISMSITGGWADSDTTAVAAGAIVGGFWFI